MPAPAGLPWPPLGLPAAEEGRPRHSPPAGATLLAGPGAVPGRRRGAGGETGLFSREVPTRISTLWRYI